MPTLLRAAVVYLAYAAGAMVAMLLLVATAFYLMGAPAAGASAGAGAAAITRPSPSAAP